MSRFIEMSTKPDVPEMSLAELGTIGTGNTPSKQVNEYWDGDYPWVSAQDMDGKYIHSTIEGLTQSGKEKATIVPANSILYVCRGSIGKMSINKIECGYNQSICSFHSDTINAEYVYHCLLNKERDIKNQGVGTSFNSISKSEFAKIKIPVLDTNARTEFVSIVQQADKSKFGDFKSRFIEMFGKCEAKGVWKDILTITNGRAVGEEITSEGKYAVCGSAGIMGYCSKYSCPPDTVLIGRKGNINNPILMTEYYWNIDTAFSLNVDRNKLLPIYFYYWCKQFDFTKFNKQGVLPSLTKVDLEKIETPLPSLEQQEQFEAIVQQADKSKFELREAIKRVESMMKSFMNSEQYIIAVTSYLSK